VNIIQDVNLNCSRISRIFHTFVKASLENFSILQGGIGDLEQIQVSNSLIGKSGGNAMLSASENASLSMVPDSISVSLSVRVEPSSGDMDGKRISSLQFILNACGFLLKRYRWANEDEYYVFFEPSRHVELFVILRKQGFEARRWASSS
jgi:hypothetical protein